MVWLGKTATIKHYMQHSIYSLFTAVAPCFNFHVNDINLFLFQDRLFSPFLLFSTNLHAAFYRLKKTFARADRLRNWKPALVHRAPGVEVAGEPVNRAVANSAQRSELEGPEAGAGCLGGKGGVGGEGGGLGCMMRR